MSGANSMQNSWCNAMQKLVKKYSWHNTLRIIWVVRSLYGRELISPNISSHLTLDPGPWGEMFSQIHQFSRPGNRTFVRVWPDPERTKKNKKQNGKHGFGIGYNKTKYVVHTTLCLYVTLILSMYINMYVYTCSSMLQQNTYDYTS